MKIFFLVALMFAAYVATWYWRKKITRQHTLFKTRMDLAGDEEQAKRQLQEYLGKRR